jgi:hypothetical protein
MQFRHPKRQYEYRPIDGSLRLKDTVALTVFPCCFHVYKINISGELTMLRKTMLVLAVASALVACGKEAKESAKSGGKDANAVQLQIAPEDLLTVQSNALASGPVITGSVQPERKADLRAEVSAVVLQVLKENG